MPTTTTAAAVAVSPTSAVTESQSPTQSDSDEYEYEEIEIEEEIEVEEEVSDDEDEEEFEEDDEGNAPPSVENLDDEKGKETIVTVEEAPVCDGELTRADSVDVATKDTLVEEAAQFDGEVMKLMSADPCSNPFTEPTKELNGECMSADLCNTFVADSKKEVGPSEISLVLEQITQMSNDADAPERRLDVSGIIRRRSSSPESNEGNKRAALVCDFFAKGWCIKGTSCRFRHIEDQQNNSSVAAAAIEPHDSKGLATTSAAAPTITCTSEMTDLQKSNESPTTKVVTQPQIQNSLTISPSNHPGTNGIQENDNSQKDKPNVNADSLLNETKKNPFSLVSSYVAPIGENSSQGFQHGFHNHKFPTTDSPNVWRNPSTYLTESERLYRSKDVSAHSALFSEFSAFNWEPSRPFRSAFLISQGISPPEIQYDPIRDSIELPKIVDKAVEFPSSSKAASISSKHSGQKVNPPLNETCGKDYGYDRFFLANHVNSNENDHENDMDVDSNECELFTAKKSVNTNGDGNEKTHATPIPTRTRAPITDNIVQESGVRVSHYSLGQNDAPSRDVKVGDEGSQHHHHKQTFDPEGDMNRESKSVRHFRAALIEFVKELVKPTWRDGKLSKDAHKMVVKKAVDKVLTTLPPEHIPTAQESVDIYLSSSKSKLAKLVEGYIEKYGKL